MLLRVGIDMASGGTLETLFCDGTFDYTPIPEGCATREDRTYAGLPARNGGTLGAYVP